MCVDDEGAWLHHNHAKLANVPKMQLVVLLHCSCLGNSTVGAGKWGSVKEDVVIWSKNGCLLQMAFKSIFVPLLLSRIWPSPFSNRATMLVSRACYSVYVDVLQWASGHFTLSMRFAICVQSFDRGAMRRGWLRLHLFCGELLGVQVSSLNVSMRKMDRLWKRRLSRGDVVPCEVPSKVLVG